MNEVVPTVFSGTVIPGAPLPIAGDMAESRSSTRTAADERRLRQMVEVHFDFIWRALRGLGVPASSADDAAQNVFWIAAQKLDAITPGSERSFLFSTARGVASNVRRAQSRSPELLGDDALLMQIDGAPTPEQQLARRQGIELLERFIATLDDDARTVFLLFELEGMTTSEIASLMDVPQGTVAARLRRAREEFQAFVRRYRAAAGGQP